MDKLSNFEQRRVAQAIESIANSLSIITSDARVNKLSDVFIDEENTYLKIETIRRKIMFGISEIAEEVTNDFETNEQAINTLNRIRSHVTDDISVFLIKGIIIEIENKHKER